MIYYIRNEVDDLIGFKYNNEIYYYEKNVQGDIIAIRDSMNQLRARYTYDTWGNILSITDSYNNSITDTEHIGYINPYRYRSYYYDTETNLYYLNSRYYNPVWGRFINADGIVGANQDILSYNLYAYCSNNPVNCSDPKGMFVGDNIFDTWTTASNNMTKATGQKGKPIPKKNVLEKIKDSFVFDAGLGFGASGSGGARTKHGTVGFYSDTTIKIENGKVRRGASNSAVIGYPISDKYTLGGSGEMFHEYHEAGISEYVKHTFLFSNPFDVYDCEHTEYSYSIYGQHDSSNSSAEVSKESVFIGLSFDLHVGVGGHIKVGFNAPYTIGNLLLSSMF